MYSTYRLEQSCFGFDSHLYEPLLVCQALLVCVLCQQLIRVVLIEARALGAAAHVRHAVEKVFQLIGDLEQRVLGVCTVHNLVLS